MVSQKKPEETNDRLSFGKNAAEGIQADPGTAGKNQITTYRKRPCKNHLFNGM